MARADQIGDALEKAFPGLRVTSTVRTRAEQDALIRAGKTKATNSQHLSGNGLDVVLPKGVTPQQVNGWLAKQGITPGEFLNESGRGSNQGTGAHLHIGLAAKQAKGGDRSSAGGGTSFDRAKASRDRATGPSMQAVHDAYLRTGKAGGMTPQEAAQYERAVLDGHVMLPRGASIRAKPAVPALPAQVVKAYNSHAMDDDPEARAEIERAVREGEVSLPRGMSLQKPKPRTFGEKVEMGLQAMGKGVSDVADVFTGRGNPAGAAAPMLNLIPKGAMQAGLDYFTQGLAKPESDTEKVVTEGIRGATGGLITGPLLGGETMLARAGSTALDVVSGASAGAAQETARQAGAGPVGQIVAGLAGGAAPIGLAASASRIRPRNITEAVAETPKAAIIDEAGNLTPDGQEFAARHGASPEEVAAAYEAPPAVQRGTANDQMPEVAAREATTNEPVAEPVPVREEPTVAPQEKTELPPQPNAPDNGPDAAPVAPVARVANANEFGIDLTRGQATKNFDVQDAEMRLRNSNGPQAEQMRAFTAKQAEQVKIAVDQFKQAFGDATMTPEERGTAVQEAIRELRDNGAKGVSALYKQARELGQEVPLDTAGIRQIYDRLMVEANVPDAVKAEITQEAARYGLIGKVTPVKGGTTAENGITTVKLDNGQQVRFYGEPQVLRLDNAEEFRKVISRLYPSDGPRKLTSLMKGAIDEATEAAATNLAKGEGAEVPEAMRAAREAFQEQVKTFKAKDVVQAIADWKKGAEDVTGALKPEQVIKAAFATTSDLKRIKAVLLSKPTVNSKAAWKAIQAHGVAQIFDQATTRTTNISGEITDAVSGAKLRTAIESFGTDKLKVLLEPKDYNTMMRLRSAIEDVTVPIAGTTNPSGSGNLIMRLVKDVDNQVTAAFAAAGTAIGGAAGGAIGGTIGRTVSPAIKAVKEGKQAAETLENAVSYTPEKAATDTGAPKPGMTAKAGEAVKQAGSRTLSAFIDTYGNARVLAPVLATTSGAEE